MSQKIEGMPRYSTKIVGLMEWHSITRQIGEMEWHSITWKKMSYRCVRRFRRNQGLK